MLQGEDAEPSYVDASGWGMPPGPIVSPRRTAKFFSKSPPEQTGSESDSDNNSLRRVAGKSQAPEVWTMSEVPSDKSVSDGNESGIGDTDVDETGTVANSEEELELLQAKIKSIHDQRKVSSAW